MTDIDTKTYVIEKILDDLKSINIKIFNVEKISSVADRMIVCSGRSSRHVSSIANNLIDEAKKFQLKTIGHEGLEASDWVLVDFGDIVVHVMQQEARDYYNLEELWDKAPKIPSKITAAQQ